MQRKLSFHDMSGTGTKNETKKKIQTVNELYK